RLLLRAGLDRLRAEVPRRLVGGAAARLGGGARPARLAPPLGGDRHARRLRLPRRAPGRRPPCARLYPRHDPEPARPPGARPETRLVPRPARGDAEVAPA